jgi:hypothetical protein
MITIVTREQAEAVAKKFHGNVVEWESGVLGSRWGVMIDAGDQFLVLSRDGWAVRDNEHRTLAGSY